MLKRTGSILGKAIAAVLSIVILALIGTGAMLSRGPVSLAPIAPYLEGFMDDQSWGFKVRFDDAVLIWEGWRKKLDLRVIGVRFVDDGGQPLIVVPRMSVVVDGQSLLAGRFRVTGLELIEPALRLLRHTDGQIEIANSDPSRQSNGRNGLMVAPGAFSAGGGAGLEAFGGLRFLSVRGAALSFHDTASDLRLSVPAADLSLHQEVDGVSMRLASRLRIGQSEAAFGISAFYQSETEPVIAAVNFAEVDIAGLAKEIGGDRLAALRGLSVVAAGRLDLAVLPDGVVEDLSFDVITGAGQIALPQIRRAPLEISSLAAKGRFSGNFTRLAVTDMQLDLDGGLEAQATGEWSRGEAGTTLKAKGGFFNLPVGKLAHYWPEDLGVDARRWVLENVHGGLIPEARFDIDLRPDDWDRATPRPGMARLDWTFQNVSARYFGDLPPLDSANGTGFVDGLEFGLTVTDAVAGGLEVSEGRLHVADLTARPPILDIEFVSRGAMADALAVLDARPLRLAKALSIVPGEVGGRSATRARFRIPLRQDVTLEKIGYSAAANIADMSLAGMPGGYGLTHGAFSLTADPEGLQISGQGAVNGVPMEVEWQRSFQVPPTAAADVLSVRGRMDLAQWRDLGLQSLPGLRGSIGLAATVELFDGGRRRGRAQLDLGGAELDWRQIGWAKPVDIPARLDLSFESAKEDAPTQYGFDFAGGGLNARGRAAFDPARGLTALSSDGFRLGATQLAMDLAVRPDGGYRLDLRGPSLDLRAFVPKLLDGTPSADEPFMELNLDVQRVFLTDEVELNRLTGTGSRLAGEWRRADMHATMAGGQTVGFTVRPEGNDRRFIVIAGDAGGMARALGLYPDARGGTMFLTFLVPAADGPDDTIIGSLRADNFRVVRAQVLTRLLTLGSLTGLSDALNDKGITFTRLDVPFTMRGRRLNIDRARAVGPALAVIATGDYGRDDEALQFQGTVVPSYTINSVLGVIPILGELLIGRKGEGVFAFTYKVNGTLSQPKVSVNLLSGLAPGFLRRIVEGLETPAVGQKDLNPGSEDR